MDFLVEVGIESVERQALHLTDLLLDYLRESPYEIRSSLESKHRSAIVSFSGKENQRLMERLKERRIVVSLRERGIRVSPHFYNTEEEIERLIEVLKEEA